MLMVPKFAKLGFVYVCDEPWEISRVISEYTWTTLAIRHYHFWLILEIT